MYMRQSEKLLHKTNWRNLKLTYAKENKEKKDVQLVLQVSLNAFQIKHKLLNKTSKETRALQSVNSCHTWYSFRWLLPVNSAPVRVGEKHRSISGGNLKLHLQRCSCEVLISSTITLVSCWLSWPQRGELCWIHHCQAILVSFWRPRSGWLCWWNSWAGRGPCPQRPESVSQLLGGWHKTWSRTPPGPTNEEGCLVSAKEYNWLITERWPSSVMMSDFTVCQGL